MPEVILTGPEGRLEGRYQPGAGPRAPVAILLQPHPAQGTMNHPIVLALYQSFVRRGFATLRFNFRGVGRSQGTFDNGIGELSDAASALDWLQQFNPEAHTTWVGGFSFGAWIGMQLLMRRPEVEGFISIAPPANLYDFSFLAPCPSSHLLERPRLAAPRPSAAGRQVGALSARQRARPYCCAQGQPPLAGLLANWWWAVRTPLPLWARRPTPWSPP